MKKILLSLCLSTALFGSIYGAEKRPRDDNSPGQPSKRQKTDAGLLFVKPEPVETRPLLTRSDIEQNIHRINTQRGRNNCLQCAVSFFNWMHSQNEYPQSVNNRIPRAANVDIFDTHIELIDPVQLAKLRFQGEELVLEEDDTFSTHSFSYAQGRHPNLVQVPGEMLRDMLSQRLYDKKFAASILYFYHANTQELGHFANTYSYLDDGVITHLFVDAQSRTVLSLDAYVDYVKGMGLNPTPYIWTPSDVVPGRMSAMVREMNKVKGEPASSMEHPFHLEDDSSSSSSSSSASSSSTTTTTTETEALDRDAIIKKWTGRKWAPGFKNSLTDDEKIQAIAELKKVRVIYSQMVIMWECGDTTIGHFWNHYKKHGTAPIRHTVVLLSQEQIKTVRQMYTEGKSKKEIAQAFGCSKSKVSKYTKDLPKQNKQKLTPEKIATIHQMYREGKSKKEITEAVGCSRHTVSKYTKDLCEQKKS